MSWLPSLWLLLQAHRKAVGVVALAMMLGGAAWVGAHRYNELQREKGRAEMRALQLDSLLKLREASLAVALQEKAAAKVTADSTALVAQRIRTRIITRLDTLHDTVSIKVPEVREMIRTVAVADSVAIDKAKAETAAADRVAADERAEKLLYKQKWEANAPRITYPPPDKWKNRGKGALVGALTTLLILKTVQR